MVHGHGMVTLYVIKSVITNLREARTVDVRGESSVGCCEPRFRSLRRKHLAQRIKCPRSKPRHENVDIDMYVRQTNSRYVDFRQDLRGVLSTR